MRVKELIINKFQSDKIFSSIRSKKDLLEVLIDIVKFYLISDFVRAEHPVGRVVLCKGRMSRVFAFKEDKYISFNFPLNFHDEDGQIRFSHRAVGEVDSRITSIILDFLHEDIFSKECPLTFVDPVVEVEKEIPGIWEMYRDLLMFEDGYVRYDYDELREDGARHPVNHLDIFYSSNGTFKLGLDSRISEEVLQDLLNVETDCGFVGFK